MLWEEHELTVNQINEKILTQQNLLDELVQSLKPKLEEDKVRQIMNEEFRSSPILTQKEEKL